MEKPDEEARFGPAARGMTREYAEGLRDHKLAVFKDFQRIIPRLEEVFPENAIVVRPHPTENHGMYRNIADRCQRVYVTNDGNVVPWLTVAKAVIHNGVPPVLKPMSPERLPSVIGQASKKPMITDFIGCPTG